MRDEFGLVMTLRIWVTKGRAAEDAGRFFAGEATTGGAGDGQGWPRVTLIEGCLGDLNEVLYRPAHVPAPFKQQGESGKRTGASSG